MSLKNHQGKSIRIKRVSTIAFCVLLTLSFLILSFPASADEATVEKYAPVLYFESMERLFPIEAEFHIDN